MSIDVSNATSRRNSRDIYFRFDFCQGFIALQRHWMQFEGLLSTSICTTLGWLFEKHLSVLNCICQVNKSVTDYRIWHPNTHSLKVPIGPMGGSASLVVRKRAREKEKTSKVFWQIVIQFAIENATWRLKSASFDCSANMQTVAKQLHRIFIEFIYTKYFICFFCILMLFYGVWHTNIYRVLHPSTWHVYSCWMLLILSFVPSLEHAC